MRDKQKSKPSYLLEFPDEEFKLRLKMASLKTQTNMKDFMLEAILEKIDQVENKVWLD